MSSAPATHTIHATPNERAATIRRVAEAARAASRIVAKATPEQRTAALRKKFPI